jgi:hypothetical protein
MKLYELADSYNAFLEAVDNGEIPNEAVADTLDSIEAAVEDKVEAIIVVIKNLQAESKALEAEEQSLKDRRKAKENRVEWLKNYLYSQMERMGMRKIETSRGVLAIKKNPESVVIDNEAELIDWLEKNRPEWLKYSQPSISKKDVLDAIKGGETIPYVHTERKERVEIK